LSERPPRPSRGADVTLKIPRPLYDRLSQVIEGTGFRSVTEFAVYVLRDLVADHEAAHSEDLSRDEIEAVRRRLRSLGYLDDF
jgi:hypothetical protein